MEKKSKKVISTNWSVVLNSGPNFFLTFGLDWKFWFDLFGFSVQLSTLYFSYQRENSLTLLSLNLKPTMRTHPSICIVVKSSVLLLLCLLLNHELLFWEMNLVVVDLHEIKSVRKSQESMVKQRNKELIIYKKIKCKLQYLFA